MSEAPRARFARKRFGQHFLEPVWAAKVVAAVAPAESETFLEIGPGAGAITRLLAARARQVLAFEIDRDLAAEMRDAGIPNLRLVEGDFLDVTPDGMQAALSALPLPVDTLRLAANLPYNVASPILFKLLELIDGGLALDNASVMVQREVADRLLAQVGTKEYGVLTVMIRHRAAISRVLQLPAGAFRPPPKVLSTVVRLDFHAPSPPVRSVQAFAELTHAIFSRRRKTLGNALLALPRPPGKPPRQLLADAGIDAIRRPETLSLEELGRIADALDAVDPRHGPTGPP